MMKKLIVLFCLLYNLPVFAQRGLYIAPHAGIGITDVSYHATGFIGGFTRPSQDREQSFAAGIDVGYLLRRWDLQTGLGIIRTGYQNHIQMYEYNPTFTSMILISEGSLHYRYMHIVLPLAAGYQILLTKKLSFEPVLGTELSYNPGEQRKVVLEGHNSMVRENADTFYRHYARVSVWGKAALAAHYGLTEQIDILAGFTGRYMLTNFIKNDAVAPGSAIYQHPWLMTFDAGVRYSLHKKNKQ